MSKIELINGDCLVEMKKIPDKSIDLVLTDPPYGIGIDGQKGCICVNPKHNRKSYEFGNEYQGGFADLRDRLEHCDGKT